MSVTGVDEPPVCLAMAKFLDSSGFLHMQPRPGFPLEVLNFWQYIGKYPISSTGFEHYFEHFYLIFKKTSIRNKYTLFSFSSVCMPVS